MYTVHVLLWWGLLFSYSNGDTLCLLHSGTLSSHHLWALNRFADQEADLPEGLREETQPTGKGGWGQISALINCWEVKLFFNNTCKQLPSNQSFDKQVSSCQKGGGVSRWGEWIGKATAYKFVTCTLIGVHSTMLLVDPIKPLQTGVCNSDATWHGGHLMHGRVPPMSSGISILYSIAIRNPLPNPTDTTTPPLAWLLKLSC